MKHSFIFPSVVIGLILCAFCSYVKVFDIVQLKGVVRFWVLVSILLLVLGVFKLIIKKDKTVVIIAISFIFLIILSSGISNGIHKHYYEQVFTQGKKIGMALDNYFEDNNIFPKTLNELLPRYIDYIPQVNTPWYKGEFTYFPTQNGTKYNLSVNGYRYDGRGWIQKP